MATGNAFSASAAPQAARVTGGTRIDSSALPFYFKPGVGWWTAAMRRPESGWMISKIRSGCIGATPFSIAPHLPEGAEPGQGHRRDQEDDDRAQELTATAGGDPQCRNPQRDRS